MPPLSLYVTPFAATWRQSPAGRLCFLLLSRSFRFLFLSCAARRDLCALCALAPRMGRPRAADGSGGEGLAVAGGREDAKEKKGATNAPERVDTQTRIFDIFFYSRRFVRRGWLASLGHERLIVTTPRRWYDLARATRGRGRRLGRCPLGAREAAVCAHGAR